MYIENAGQALGFVCEWCESTFDNAPECLKHEEGCRERHRGESKPLKQTWPNGPKQRRIEL
jgi:hypothetical protein